MSTFSSKWEKSNSTGFTTRMRESVKNPGPLKPRLDLAVRQIQVQVAKLDATTAKLRERDASIFNKVVSSIQKHDSQHASVYANELAEVRKMNRMVTQAKLALEQITLRLNTITELGDIVVTLTPAMSVIRSVQAGTRQRPSGGRRRDRRDIRPAEQHPGGCGHGGRIQPELRGCQRGRREGPGRGCSSGRAEDEGEVPRDSLWAPLCGRFRRDISRETESGVHARGAEKLAARAKHPLHSSFFFNAL